MKQISATAISRVASSMSPYFFDAVHRAKAIREFEGVAQYILFEESIQPIDTSKMEWISGTHESVPGISDNVFRFIQLFVGDRRIVVDLPNTVLSSNDSERLVSRGFEVDVECSFQPLQKFYRLTQIDLVVIDLTFVWCGLWFMQSIPKCEIQRY